MPVQTSKYAIEAAGVTKRFGAIPALRGATLSVPTGTCVAVFGPNGAGKSTLIGVLSTLVRPTGGTARVAGYDVVSDGIDVRRHLGVISHHPWVYDRLTVHDNLAFFARLYGVSDRERRIRTLLDELELAAWSDQEAGTLSRGMRQRLAIARALLPDPPVLLLDEPFTGLDRHSSHVFAERLAALRQRGRTILLVTHHVEEGWALADRAVVLLRGKVVYETDVTPEGAPSFGATYDAIIAGEAA